MKIGYKITSGFAVGMFMVLVMGLYTIKQLQPAKEAVRIIKDDTTILLELSSKTLSNYQDAIYYIRGFLTSRAQSDYDNFLKYFEDAKKNLQLTQEHIADKSHLVHMKESVDKVTKFFVVYEKAVKKLYEINSSLENVSNSGSGGMGSLLNQYKNIIPILQQAANETGNKYAANLLVSISSRLMDIYYLRGNFVNALWKNDVEQIKQSANGIRELITQFNTFSETIRFPSIQNVLKEITVMLQSYYDVTTNVSALTEENITELAYRRKVADDLSNALTQFTKDNFELINLEVMAVNTNLNQIITVTYILTAVILLITIIASFFITRAITVPINRTNRFAQSVANGNLDQHLNIRSKDEIGELTTSLNTMVDSLKAKVSEAQKQTETATRKEEEAKVATAKAEDALRKAETAKRDGMVTAANQLEDIVNIISSASTQLSAQVEESERGATNQANRVSETATAMEEMSSTVIEVAKNASETSDISAQTRQKAIEGAEVVRKMVESIEKVHTRSRDLKSDMSILGEHAQSINQIMGVISDIADQTNLLALNAAIEAARAGEAGRGFAVVADEVRKLAEKTMVSTTDVGNAIQAIQESAKQSMNQVDSAVHDIEIATGLATESGHALDEIVSMAESTADQIRAIATASEEQSASTEEINISISEINNIARETSQAMDEANKAVSELARQTQVLTNVITDMKETS